MTKHNCQKTDLDHVRCVRACVRTDNQTGVQRTWLKTQCPDTWINVWSTMRQNRCLRTSLNCEEWGTTCDKTLGCWAGHRMMNTWPQHVTSIWTHKPDTPTHNRNVCSSRLPGHVFWICVLVISGQANTCETCSQHFPVHITNMSPAWSLHLLYIYFTWSFSANKCFRSQLIQKFPTKKPAFVTIDIRFRNEKNTFFLAISSLPLVCGY